MFPPSVKKHFSDKQPSLTRQEINRRYTVGPSVDHALARALNLHGDEAILDVGTGVSPTLTRLREQGHGGMLTGLSFPSSQRGRARATSPIPVVTTNTSTLPFTDACFDVVLSQHALYYFDHVLPVLHEYGRVVRPGGRVVATTRAKGHLQAYWDALEEAFGTDPELQYIFEEPRASPFNDVNGAALMGCAFGNVETVIVENDFIFPHPQPVLQFFDTFRSLHVIEQATWDRALDQLHAVLLRRFESGSWRVQRRTAILVSTNAAGAAR